MRIRSSLDDCWGAGGGGNCREWLMSSFLLSFFRREGEGSKGNLRDREKLEFQCSCLMAGV